MGGWADFVIGSMKTRRRWEVAHRTRSCLILVASFTCLFAGIPDPPATASPPAGHGYWLAGADGGVFSFGGAQFYGSTGSLVLQRPIVGIAATPNRLGYWLVAS